MNEAEAATPFKSILCGVEGSPSSTEAARQAVKLASAGADLRFMTVHTSFEPGPDNHLDRLQAGLDEAGALARTAGVTASSELREARYAVEALLSESEHHDLLAIGTQGTSRASGIVFGNTASESAHGAEGPVLIAREPPADAFPKDILLANDGSPGSWAPARLATGIASAFGSKVHVVHVADGKHPESQQVLDAQVEEIGATLGEAPSLSQPDGHPTQEIVDAATEMGSSLIVCGRRGLRGIEALGSVSERVMHQAGCSVLLVPAGEDA